jgi:hypothetical protein
MFQLSDLLKAIGPTASIVFAAWIFMGFLQQRYDAAVDRYRELIAEYRDNAPSDDRRSDIKEQVAIYKHRCELMRYATSVGLVSAIFLIGTLMIGALDVIFPHLSLLAYLGAGSALMGFALVIVAAMIVLVEGASVQDQLDHELLDVKDLAARTGQ